MFAFPPVKRESEVTELYVHIHDIQTTKRDLKCKFCSVTIISPDRTMFPSILWRY